MEKTPAAFIHNSTAEFLIFTAQAGEDSIEVRCKDENVWLTQKMMATLFAVTVPTINEHLKNIFASEELEQDAVIRKFRTTASDGKQYLTNFYNLDAIISVGYRVNSRRATQFRQWATRALREFAIKGYVLDKKSLTFTQLPLITTRTLQQHESFLPRYRISCIMPFTAILRLNLFWSGPVGIKQIWD
jgi:hypothetical protein